MKQLKISVHLHECFAWTAKLPTLCLMNSFSGVQAPNNTWTESKPGNQASIPSSNMSDQRKASRVQSQNVSESESFSLYPSSEPTLLLHRLTMLPRLERVVLLKWSFLKQTKLTAVIVLEGEKGIMVAKMRARQSATSLLGAQARAGVWPGRKCRQGSG